MKVRRDRLVKMLRNNVATVTFRKVDGTKRVMRCTLNSDLFSKRVLNELNESNSDRGITPGVLPVYDLDKKGFRSFRLNSIISIKRAAA